MNTRCFSKVWESAWNSHDIDLILSHYSENIVFRSNKAISLVGSGEIEGKESLRAYWTEALLHQPDLKFEVLDVFHGYQMLVVLYKNHKGILATETLYFDSNSQIYKAAACHREPEY